MKLATSEKTPTATASPIATGCASQNDATVIDTIAPQSQAHAASLHRRISRVPAGETLRAVVLPPVGPRAGRGCELMSAILAKVPRSDIDAGCDQKKDRYHWQFRDGQINNPAAHGCRPDHRRHGLRLPLQGIITLS